VSLSKSATKFQNLLRERGLDLTVVELPASTRTADDAALALNCEKSQIVKSLVFRHAATGDPVIVLASGTNRVNEEAISAMVGGGIAKADADFVKSATGYSIGGVPPLGHKQAARVFVDEDLLAFEEVWAAAGTPNAVFKISGKITDILPEHTLVSMR
jgi:prolyl-tRNA editing enzyme YbaK/EbsC (Cys-tRNA(Pro) deacylase)